MANHKQALKRHRQSLVRQARNKFYKRTMATFVKKAETAQTDEATAPEDKESALRKAISTIAHVAAKGVIPKKRAARKISRLMKAFSK